MKEEKSVVLHDKREIYLNDESDITISTVFNGEWKQAYSVQYPSEGYGGGNLYLSLSEVYLLFSYYSGQSEEAFILFRIMGDMLEPVYESGYHWGEEAGYCFSENEKYLFQTLRTGWWCEDEAGTDKDGNSFYEFGEINCLDIMTKTFCKHRIHIYPPNGYEEVTDAGEFRLSETVGSGILHVRMPWGEETLTLPLEDMIVFKAE